MDGTGSDTATGRGRPLPGWLLWLIVALIAAGVLFLTGLLTMWLMVARGAEGVAALSLTPMVFLLISMMMFRGRQGRLDDRRFAVMTIGIAFISGTLALGVFAFMAAPDWGVLTLGVAHPGRAWVAFTESATVFGVLGYPVARRVPWVDLMRAGADGRVPLAPRRTENGRGAGHEGGSERAR